MAGMSLSETGSGVGSHADLKETPMPGFGSGGNIPVEDGNERFIPPGWPDRYGTSSRVEFEQAVGLDDARWWHENFVDKHGFYPDDLAVRLSQGTPGEKKLVYEWISAAQGSFALKMEGADGNRRIWFHGSQLSVRGGLFREATFYQDRLDVELDYRGRRYAQAVMRPIVALAEQLGVIRLELDAQDIGGYLWAEAGALPKGSWTDIQQAVRPRLDRLRRRGEITLERQDQVAEMLERGPSDPRLLWAISRLPELVKSTHARNPMDPERIALGKELLIGVNWKAEFDLEERFSRLTLMRWLRRAP